MSSPENGLRWRLESLTERVKELEKAEVAVLEERVKHLGERLGDLKESLVDDLHVLRDEQQAARRENRAFMGTVLAGGLLFLLSLVVERMIG